MSGKKRRRGAGRRSPDMDTLSGKRRRLGAGGRKGSAANTANTGGGNGGTDSEENSDPLSTRHQQQQQLLGRRSPKPCQYNFLVQLGEWVWVGNRRIACVSVRRGLLINAYFIICLQMPQ